MKNVCFYMLSPSIIFSTKGLKVIYVPPKEEKYFFLISGGVNKLQIGNNCDITGVNLSHTFLYLYQAIQYFKQFHKRMNSNTTGWNLYWSKLAVESICIKITALGSEYFLNPWYINQRINTLLKLMKSITQ